MSQKKSKEGARLWLITAQDDLGTAFILKDKNKNAHACFYSKQAAEKAIKAVWYYLDMDPWGHSIFKLIKDLKEANLKIFQKVGICLFLIASHFLNQQSFEDLWALVYL